MLETNSNFTVEFLPFDTDIFGIKCGRVIINTAVLSKDELEGMMGSAKNSQIKHLVAKVPSEWVSVCNHLEDLDFKFKLCSLELEKNIHETDGPEDVVLYNDGNDRRLAEITKTSFSSGTRFHFEERFTGEQISEVYNRWINNLIKDQDVQIYVHLDKETITGFVTLKMDSSNLKKGHIGLFAVDKKYQGKGIGQKLLDALNGRLSDKVDTFSVTTESLNYSALKAYLSNGFSIKRSWNVFHCNII